MPGNGPSLWPFPGPSPEMEGARPLLLVNMAADPGRDPKARPSLEWAADPLFCPWSVVRGPWWGDRPSCPRPPPTIAPKRLAGSDIRVSGQQTTDQGQRTK